MLNARMVVRGSGDHLRKTRQAAHASHLPMGPKSQRRCCVARSEQIPQGRQRSQSDLPEVLVVGGSSGIGLETVAGLLQQGCKVSAVARTESSARRLQATLFQRQLPPIEQIYVADLQHLAQALQLANLVEQRHRHLDLLIHSLGVFSPQRSMTKEHIEQNLAVNALAPWLLTQRLLPMLQRSPRGRIVSVSSQAHRGTWLRPMGLDWSNLQGERSYTFLDQYATSKFVQLTLLEGLRTHPGLQHVQLYHVHPGLVRTALGRALPPFLTWFHHAIACSSLEGARPVLRLAQLDRQVPQGYYDRFVLAKPFALSLDGSTQQALQGWAQHCLDKAMEASPPALPNIEIC